MQHLAIEIGLFFGGFRSPIRRPPVSRNSGRVSRVGYAFTKFGDVISVVLSATSGRDMSRAAIVFTQ